MHVRISSPGRRPGRGHAGRRRCVRVRSAGRPGWHWGGLAPAGAAEQVTGAGARLRARPADPAGTTPPAHQAKPQPDSPTPTRTRRHRRSDRRRPARRRPPPAARRASTSVRWRRTWPGWAGSGTVTVDGRQSAADCAAIKKFQQRYDIRPAEGRAGPTTLDVAKRLATTDVEPLQGRLRHHLLRRPDPADHLGDARRQGGRRRRPSPGPACPATPPRPAPTRSTSATSRSGPTRTRCGCRTGSTSPGGSGFHETTTYLHETSIGSHGCVNLLHADAVRLVGAGQGRHPGGPLSAAAPAPEPIAARPSRPTVDRCPGPGVTAVLARVPPWKPRAGPGGRLG